MSDLERKAAQPSVLASSDSLPALIGRLGEDLTMLLESKLGLLRIEVKEDIAAYIRGGVHVAVGALIGAVGFGLLCAAMALTLSTLVRQAANVGAPAAYSVGFAAVGLCFLGSGAFVATRAVQRLTQTELTPKRSVEELEKDREWLRPSR